MKKLFLLAILLALPLAARAQTNIQLRVQVDGVNSTLNLDRTGSKKDQYRLDGILFAYTNYVSSLATNAVPLSKGAWLLSQHTVLVDDYARQNQTQINLDTAAKLQNLLTINPDRLSAAQLATLASIAALAP